jgi:hypothetical protein
MIWPEVNCVPHFGYVYQVEDILTEINKRTGRQLQLHSFWKYPIWEDSCACFKLHDKSATPGRVMDLSIPESAFIEFGEIIKLTDRATSEITLGIETFFENAASGHASS